MILANYSRSETGELVKTVKLIMYKKENWVTHEKNRRKN